MKPLFSCVYKKSFRCAFRELEGTFFIVPTGDMKPGDQAVFYTLNEVGRDIWKRLDGHKSLGEIASELLELYDVDPEQLLMDVEDFISDMEAKAVVERVDISGG